MRDIYCPYCYTEQEASDEDNEEDYTYEHECKHCGKVFGYQVSWNPSYHEFKLPCANGEEHLWKEIRGWPKEYYENRRRCAYCDQEITIKV